MEDKVGGKTNLLSSENDKKRLSHGYSELFESVFILKCLTMTFVAT